VRTVAAIPALGLLAGAVAGFLLPEVIQPFAATLLICGAGAALWAWSLSNALAVSLLVTAAFAAGGALLSADAWRQAWRPTLRVAFEQLAANERSHAVFEGRTVPEDDEAFAIVEGVFRADGALTESGVSLNVAIDAIGNPESQAADVRVAGGLLVTVIGSLGPSSIDRWRAGRRVRMPVQLHRPSRYLDPGVPDGERALARGGVTLVGTVKSASLVEVLANGTGWSEAAGEIRHFVRTAIGGFVGRWSPRSAAIVNAIVIGDRAGLDDDVRRRLQEAGTYHVIAISGGNIAILAGLLVGAFRVAGRLGRGAMITAACLLVGYASLVGGGASVDRATFMAVVYFAARALDHRSPALNGLCLVAAILVAADPLSIADPAFCLTCGATLGILMASAIAPRLSTVRGMFIASVAAEVILFPVGALVFSRVTFAGLGLNFLAIPLMAVTQVAGMAVPPLALISSALAGIAGWIAHAGAAGLVWSADLVRFAPALAYRVAPPSWPAVILYYASISLCWALFQRRAHISGSGESRSTRRVRHGAFAAAVLAALWILAEPWALWASRGDGLLHLTFLDVGQGDSILLRFPRGAAMLVDAGGIAGSSGFDIGDRVVAPVLREQGIRRLDFLVLTHGDPDHIGGAAAIVNEFRPHEVWEGIPVPPFAPLAKLRAQAQEMRGRWRNVYRGDHLSIEGVDVEARHPAPAEWERQKVRNDDSIVLGVRWRDVYVLLTGDIGREVENIQGDDGQPAPLRVLKAPHHGSLTSSSPEFLQAIAPQIAVFSAGRSNHFGHPAPAVLQRYRDVAAAIFRTDQDGAVMLDTNGYSIDIRTFTGRHLTLAAASAHHEGTKATKGAKR
jgi:competence protein ComEC